MNILVTGGTGFIGSHLVEALVENGYRVKVIARNPKKAKINEKKGARIVIGGLQDDQFLRKELSGIDMVCHLAAIPGDDWGIPQECYERVNVFVTQNLLKAARVNNIKRFIFCSSIQAAIPHTFYGKSKLDAEKIVKKSGLEYTIVRPAVVYGPGDTRSIPRIYKLAKKGFFPLLDGGKARLPIIFIDDLIDLFLKCLRPEAKNKTFWGIGEKIVFKDLVETVSRETGRFCWKFSLPARLLRIVAVPFELVSLVTGIRPPITRQQIDFVTLDWHAKIPKEEGNFWRPKVILKEGIRKTIKL